MQNILKRTRPGSEEEVQATQAYDALEKVRPSTQSPQLRSITQLQGTKVALYFSLALTFAKDPCHCDR